MNDDRRRYRKIFIRLWKNPDFRALPDAEKLMTLYLLSGPQTNRLGLFHLSFGAGVEDLEWSLTLFRKRLEKVCHVFGWHVDHAVNVIWIPSWWDFNDVRENFKVMQGALVDLHEVPNTPLIDRFLGHLVHVPKGLHYLFENLSAKRAIPRKISDSGIQEQEQEQEQKQEQEQEQEKALPRTTPDALAVVWNRHREPGPKVDTLTPDRKRRYVKALETQPNLSEWETVIRWINTQPWANASGTGDHANWRATLDWLAKPGKVGEYLERAKTDALIGPRMINTAGQKTIAAAERVKTLLRKDA